ncbi:uncharacterized protein LOC122372406 [Amphibalanus amphitrite]|uniref:uncharacterized protein LOC122372406 n=1 Tax=Amphibalanus amphitrite TaxID=1232801 RepID=UPI001C921EE0|nr:uncharacterized protein LOC122372406 [Amphibalanus amphitrite]
MVGERSGGYKRFLDSDEQMSRQTGWRRKKPKSSTTEQRSEDFQIAPDENSREEPCHGDTTGTIGDAAMVQQTPSLSPGPHTEVPEANEAGSDNDDLDAGDIEEQCSEPGVPDIGDLSDGDVMSVILAFSIRHNLSKVAVKDLLDLLHVLGTTRNVPESRYKLFKTIMEEISEQKFTHFYCSFCLAYIEGEPDGCVACEQPFSKKDALKKGNYFLYIPMRQQIKEMLESGYVAREMICCDHDADLLCDAVDGKRCKRFSRPGDEGIPFLTINWNFDGLPVYKASSASLWPILVQINELNYSARKEQLLMCGLWLGDKKPLWSTYSKPFLAELKSMGTDGISWRRGSELMRTIIKTQAIVCDAPARCMVQGIHQFNGAYGCAWCLHEGTVVRKGDGTARIYEHRTDVERRTHASVIASARTAIQENISHHNGVKAASPLLLLPAECGVDIVDSFSADYMHAILLGVVRQFLDLWFSSKWSSSPFSIRSSLREADDRLMAVRPPQDLSRTPRTLRDSAHWKASECRNWLLYYSVPVLFGLLAPRFLDHWCLLVSAVFALLQGQVAASEVLRASHKLLAFNKGVGLLYGDEHMSSNVHACIHLGESVRNLGPLWACSGFPFEGYMMKIKKFFSGTTYLSDQAANTFLMLRILKKSTSNEQCNEKVARLVQKWLGVYSHLDRAMRSPDNSAVGLNSPKAGRLQEYERRLLQGHGIDVSADTSVFHFSRAVIGGSICCTEEYGRSMKRNSFTLFTRFGIGCVQNICFLSVDGMECFLFLKRMEAASCPIPSLEHVRNVRASTSGAVFLCRAADVLCNAVVVPRTVNGEHVLVCCRQPNKVEKD